MIKKASRWQKIRKFFQDVHLWLGLTGGIVILVVCFSGTAYVYNKELTEWASPHLYRVDKPGDSKIDISRLVSTVGEVSGGKVASILIPEEKEKTYILYVKQEGEKSKFGTPYFVNPYTGSIQGSGNDEGRMKEFMSRMFSLHRWLLLDKVESPIISGVENRELGRWITGTSTLLFTLGCLTGLILWFPNKIKNWRQGLKVKTSGNWKRTNHDLHNTLAFYSLIFLLMMGLTGPQWSFEWYRTGLQKTLGTYQEQGARNSRKEKPVAKERNQQIARSGLPIHQVLLLANEELNFPGDVRMTMPGKGDLSYQINKTKTGFFAPAAGDRVTIDGGTGNTLSKEIFNQKPLNERIAGSIKALHIGTVYGGFTKLLYFFTCLIATSLPVTGTLIWNNKLKKKRKRAKKARVIVASRPVAV